MVFQSGSRELSVVATWSACEKLSALRQGLRRSAIRSTRKGTLFYNVLVKTVGGSRSDRYQTEQVWGSLKISTGRADWLLALRMKVCSSWHSLLFRIGFGAAM